MEKTAKVIQKPFGWPFLPARMQYADFAASRIGRIVVRSPWFQPLLIFANLAIFTILILAGIFGTPVGNHNAAIIMVWIFWFFILMALLIPIGGRAWCIMCPLPALGEWASRGSIIQKSSRTFNLGVKWPKRLDNIWLQNFGFLLIAVLSPLILTRPWATSWMLIGFIVLAIILSVVFVHQKKIGRIFCKYVCPVGGFIGLYSLTGPVEVKIKDREVCRRDRTRSCVVGTDKSWGCPWFQVLPNMDRNLYCGLCTECIKSCPYDNIAFRLRPFAADLLKVRKLDEAFKSFIMIGCGAIFLAVFFGWWGVLKDLANPITGVFAQGPIHWTNLAIYGAIVWAVALGVVPGLALTTAWLTKVISGKTEVSVKKLFIDIGYALVPFGLAVWVAFTVGMILVNGSYVIPVLSDPLGWGWNLFGTAHYSWRPYFPELVPYLEMLIVGVGAVASTMTALRLAKENFGEARAATATLPTTLLLIVLGGTFAYLFTAGGW